MAKPEEYLSQSKYAEHRNVTKGYIARLIKEGRLHLIKGKLNVEMSDAELDNKSNDDKAPNYWREKALHEKAKRELAELDLKLKSDQLVEVDQVGDHLDKIFSAVRQYGAGDGARTRDIQLGKMNTDMPNIKFYKELQ